MKAIATYLRVSGASQDLEPQRQRLAAYAADRGWEIAAEYTDVASGRRADRPGFAALMKQARRRAFGAVLVVRLDRVARSTRHLCEVAEELEAAGVDLVAVDQAGADTTSPQGKLLFGLLAVVAEFEADLIRSRTLDGLAAARKRGVRMGRPPALDGEAIKRARRMREAGQSQRYIAKMLGVSRAAVATALAA